MTLVVDGAVTALLPQATAVVLGADAISADRWINKVGTFGLAAAAARSGVAVYVIASRDKFVPRALEPYITLPPTPADEIWPDGPSEIPRQNIYFEATPSDLATLYLSASGVIPAEDLPGAVERGGLAIELLLSYLAQSV